MNIGRGKDNYSSIGNKRLKVLVDTRLKHYQEATTKIQKSLIVSGLVEAVHEAAGDNAFVKRDMITNQWIVVSEETAREKVRRPGNAATAPATTHTNKCL